jgi:hypothetical protein
VAYCTSRFTAIDNLATALTTRRKPLHDTLDVIDDDTISRPPETAILNDVGNTLTNLNSDVTRADAEMTHRDRDDLRAIALVAVSSR